MNGKKRFLLCMILFAVAVLMVSATPGRSEVKSALGESCTDTADCENGLVCYNKKCVGKLDAVQSCGKTADCPKGLRCIDNKCVAKQIFGAWIDPSSGLTWQNPPSEKKLNWSDAKKYCSYLELGGYSDWRLPTISELRSLIRGCPQNQTGGSCRVTDRCLSFRLCHERCDACGYKYGKCYWPSVLKGDCTYFWSSSAVVDLGHAWYVGFNFGYVDGYSYVYNDFYARCVR